ncbi:MAG: MCE family protein [Candidatus Eisenbacteria bacterium]|uniref:MCE family protein n=1 Tax=Eiseniibacteriota bacterium TaxID=2212470 RepID=A0A7Y2EAU9_UNCEI|nr:MCE family protein [Candidatus Eisenbacteria bacterium]
MASRSREIQVGIVFLLAVAVLISGILWFKEFRIGGQFYQVVVAFENTSGLQSGDAVEVQGVTSGQVSRIFYEDGRALVGLRLDRSVNIYPETKFVIENVGIMGQKLVAIYPGPPGTPVSEDTILTGEYQSGIPALMAELGGALESFDKLADQLEGFFGALEDTEPGTVSRILHNTERLTEDLADFLAATRGDLREVVGNFNVAMEDLHEVLDGRGEEFGTTLESANRAMARLDTTLAQMEVTMQRTDAILARVENGEGTLGRLSQDEELYNELRGTMTDARALLEDLKADPKKYFKFSIF